MPWGPNNYIIYPERFKLEPSDFAVGRMYKILAMRCGQGHMTNFQFRCTQSYLRNGRSESCKILYASRIYQMLALG